MPIGDPLDGYFYPALTLMMDSYILLPYACPQERYVEPQFSHLVNFTPCEALIPIRQLRQV